MTVDAKQQDGTQWNNPWDRVFNKMMGHIYSKDIMQVFLDISKDLMHIEEEEGGDDFSKSTFTYLTTSAKHCDLETLPGIIEKLGHLGGNYMTIVEQIEAKYADDINREREAKEKERAAKEKAKAQARAAKEQAHAAKEQARAANEQSVVNLLNSGINPETVATCMNMSLEEVQRLSTQRK